MKWIKMFEDFKQNNQEGSLLKQEDIIRCIEKGGQLFATIVQEIPDNDPEEPLKPVDIDEDGLIAVEQGSKIGYVKLEDVEMIEI
jgi:hypothetical protein